MAARRKSEKPAQRGGAGNVLFGVLAGLLIGLGVAAAVAFYVTRAPMPFVDRATREAAQGKPVDLSHTDPNQGLMGGGDDAGSGAASGQTSPLVPVPRAPAPNKPMDDLGALIATLPSSNGKPDAKPAADLPVPVPQAPPPGKPQALASAAPGNNAAANGNYYLQAGAYRGQGEAESLRARILLLGLPVSIQRAEVNGTPLNRVRVGPFPRLDDMNRARSRLGENKIETAIVRQ
jgi:cell division protein FtsN